jgi:5-methylcytosine-specific restriction endonuclease McrA
MVPVKKSQPEPAYLNEARLHKLDCGGEEVIRMLKSDFRNKCYLCEQKEITSLEVEHLKPHKGDKTLLYDWNNLFFSCRHCNNTKGDRYYPILNCIDNNLVLFGLNYTDLKISQNKES